MILLALLVIISMFSLAVSATNYQLLCVSKGEKVKYSLCSSAMTDFICDKNSCQSCVSYSNGVYCPANPNVCNSQQLSCSSLQSQVSGQDNGNLQNSSTNNQNTTSGNQNNNQNSNNQNASSGSQNNSSNSNTQTNNSSQQTTVIVNTQTQSGQNSQNNQQTTSPINEVSNNNRKNSVLSNKNGQTQNQNAEIVENNSEIKINPKITGAVVKSSFNGEEKFLMLSGVFLIFILAGFILLKINSKRKIYGGGKEGGTSKGF